MTKECRECSEAAPCPARPARCAPVPAVAERRLAEAPYWFVDLDREQWRRLGGEAVAPAAGGPGPEVLRSVSDRLPAAEICDIFLPMARLLDLHVTARRDLHAAMHEFLPEEAARRVPFVVGIAGSVAVGKTTIAQVLQALLRLGPGQPTVEVVTTDGFLYPQRELARRGLLERKGFPESYDRRGLIAFLAAVKSGQDQVTAPVYSHLAYDIVEGESLVLRRPDIVILEGINVLQTRDGRRRRPELFVSDFFDFSIYVDADEENITEWFLERFLALRADAVSAGGPGSGRWTATGTDEAVERARRVWTTINGRNLRENILPTRARADLIVHKRADHSVDKISLRKL
jgi:type I pantothenate kinase